MAAEHALSDDEVTQRVDRLENEKGFFFYGMAGVVGVLFIFGGSILSATIIGAIIGIPLILVGGGAIIYSALGMVYRPFKVLLGASVWTGTPLEDASAKDRKVNKEFLARCPVCGKFATLRDTSGKVIPEGARCEGCGAVVDREQVAIGEYEWRLTNGDDSRVGERKSTDEWIDELREREAKDSASAA